MSEHKFSVIPGRAVKDGRITDSIYRTLAALCMYADKDGWCWPSQGTLAEDIGKTRKTINEHLQLLEAWGYVRSAPRTRDNGSDTSKQYQVIYDVITQGVSTLDYSGGEYPRGYTHNDPMNDPINTMASSENTLSAEDEQEPAVEGGKGMVQLSIENQIYAGVKQITLPDNKDAAMRDSANLIAMGMNGIDRDLAYGIAYTFMKSRGIIIPADKVKGQRKVVASMLKQGVLPDHVQTAVSTLIEKGMTVTDLYSIEKTAVSLANPPQKGAGFYLEGL